VIEHIYECSVYKVVKHNYIIIIIIIM